MARYFVERRKKGDVSVPLEGGRAKVDCVIYERWQDIDCSTTARCGGDGKCEVSRSVGLSERTTESLEGVIEVSLGVKGIAELKSQIKATYGHEVNWTTSVTTTKTFNYRAPLCGRYTLTIYQLTREYELTYWRRRRWSLDGESWDRKWDRKITEHTNIHDALPDVEELDEVCKCRDVKPLTYDGRMRLDFGTGSVRVAYRLTSDGFEAQIADKVISFRFSDYALGVQRLESGLKISLPAEVIPAPLRFLSDLDADYVHVTATKYFDKGEEPYVVAGELLEVEDVHVTNLSTQQVLGA